MSVIVGHDATHANIGHLPPGQACGYTTGSADIRWTSADWRNHPGAVRICQDSGTDHTADVLDDESGAATDGDATVWVPKAQAAFHAGTRPGQRWPAVYKSASGITALVNALIAHGIAKDVGLFVANWDLSSAQAVADVENAAGPFPIIGVQYSSGQFYDTSIFSGSWLARVSTGGPQWRAWHSDGKTSLLQLAQKTGLWVSHILAATADQYKRYDPVTASYVSAGIWTAPIPTGATLWVRK